MGSLILQQSWGSALSNWANSVGGQLAGWVADRKSDWLAGVGGWLDGGGWPTGQLGVWLLSNTFTKRCFRNYNRSEVLCKLVQVRSPMSWLSKLNCSPEGATESALRTPVRKERCLWSLYCRFIAKYQYKNFENLWICDKVMTETCGLIFWSTLYVHKWILSKALASK